MVKRWIMAAVAVFWAVAAAAQWSPQLWVSNDYRLPWIWTNDVGQALTGVLKDGRAYEMRRALLERMLAAKNTTNGVPTNRWYRFEREALVAAKGATADMLTNFVDCAAMTNGAEAFPTFSESNSVVRLGLPTNFWSYTPWRELGRPTNSNGWRNLQRMVNAMTATVAALDWVAAGVTNAAGNLADPIGSGGSWATALADADANSIAGPFDMAPRQWVKGTNYASTGSFEASWKTSFATATNQAEICTAYSKAAALWVRGTVDASDYGAADVVEFEANGIGLTTNWTTWTGPTNLQAAGVWAVPDVGPDDLARGLDIEPYHNGTWMGFLLEGRMMFEWTADTNGFRYR